VGSPEVSLPKRGPFDFDHATAQEVAARLWEDTRLVESVNPRVYYKSSRIPLPPDVTSEGGGPAHIVVNPVDNPALLRSLASDLQKWEEKWGDVAYAAAATVEGMSKNSTIPTVFVADSGVETRKVPRNAVIVFQGNEFQGVVPKDKVVLKPGETLGQADVNEVRSITDTSVTGDGSVTVTGTLQAIDSRTGQPVKLPHTSGMHYETKCFLPVHLGRSDVLMTVPEYKNLPKFLDSIGRLLYQYFGPPIPEDP
jgi:hypothetical protein